jgi:AmmeMemoRadiSam system protein B
LIVDTETIEKVKEEGDMEDIIKKKEVDEHSLEMHMPYLYLMCERALKSEENFPKIVPLLVGSNNLEEEREIGRVLAPYMKDPENAFIISSDFCHWGDASFSYTPYSPDCNINKLRSLSRFDSVPNGEPIHETIRTIDEAAMDAVKSGSHAAFVRNLRLTKNTVCGRHPIGVAMAAMEIYADELTRNPSGRVNDDEETSDDSVEIKNPHFSIIQYDRSNLVKDPSDFSVSYVSAYAVL